MLPYPPEGPDAGLNESQANTIRYADATFEAIAGVRPAEPAPTGPRVHFPPQQVFDVIIAGAQLAHFMLSTDLRACGCCGSEGALQTDPEAHATICRVRRWFAAVDALKVGLEVR